MHRPFRNRTHAGLLLARRLASYARHPDVVVLALPRGGVPPGAALAQALDVPLDVVMVRKLALPEHPEYAVGAVAGDGQSLLQTADIERRGVPAAMLEAAIARERAEIVRRERLYRAHAPPLPLHGKVVILVDDGIATGSTMRLAVRVVRRAQAARIIVAVPVAAQVSCTELAHEVDALVCLSSPEPFLSVGQWYRDFRQVSDEEVVRLLDMARRRRVAAGTGRPAALHSHSH